MSPTLDPDDEDVSEAQDQIDHEAELNANLIGLVIKVSLDADPGVLLHYQDGRVWRVIATSQHTGSLPVTVGKVH